MIKKSVCSVRDPGSILGLERSPEDGNDYTLQYSCLENSMDRLAMGSQRVGHDWATKQQSDDGWDWPRFYHHVLSFPHSILLYFLKSFLNIIGMFKCFCFFFFTRFENFRIFFRLHSWWWLFKNFENTYFHLHYIHTHIHIHTNICIQSH